MILAKIFIFIASCCIFFGSSEAVTAECKYSTADSAFIGKIYECYVQKELNITSKESAVIDNAIGIHKDWYDHRDVNMFYAFNKNIDYFPRDLNKVFVNVKAIQISYGGIKEIHQEDLRQYTKLEMLKLDFNEIEILEDRLFANNPQLKVISLYGNKITQIGEHVFDHLNQLESLDLESNKCISKEAVTTVAVKRLIKEIRGQCQAN